MKKFSVLFCAFLYCTIAGFGQDQHFTQFYASPVSLNPALTGAFEGKYRFSFIYRDQWRKVLDNPFVTYSAAADFRFQLFEYNRRYKDALGVGVLFYNDKVPVTGFSTNQIIISSAFHKSLSTTNDQFLSLGFQLGISQRNVNYSSLSFNDQFNGSDGYSFATSEELPENNFAFADYNVGLNYSYSPAGKMGVYAGVSIHHLLEPRISFFYDEEDPEKYRDDHLFRKYSAYVNLAVPMSENVQFQPRVLFYKQGPHLAGNTGANFRFLVSDVSGTAIHLGTWIRPVTEEQNRLFVSSAVFLVGLEFQNFLMGFSYDANINDIDLARKGQGAFEISVAYLGQYDSETILCPKF